MSVTADRRQVNGVELPPAGTYVFDPAHTTVEFIGTHIFTKTRGRFTDSEGSIVIGDRPEESSVDVRIKASSLQSNSDMRDEHLKSPDFLNVEEYPQIRFTSTGIRVGEGSAFELDGDLTIKDITRPVTLTRRVPRIDDEPVREALRRVHRVDRLRA